MRSPEENSNDWDSLFVRVWAAANLTLIALTWKLWFTGFADFPRVPVLPLGSVSFALQWIAAIGVVLGFAVLVFGGSKRIVCIGVASLFFVLFVCNQHCLQPWAWQAFIMSVLLGAMTAFESKKWIARVIISIYLYSAIGKFDYQFANTLGIEFLDVVFSWLRIHQVPGETVKSKISLLFPTVELLVAIGLLFRKTRKLSAAGAIVLHLGLIAILSPAGLGHQWPVLIWNGLSMLIVAWLFLLPNGNEELERPRENSITQKLAIGFAVLILIGPLLRPLQLWDHWLAWGLYSPSNSRVELFVADSQLEKFRDLQPYIVEADDFPLSSRFAMERWSLDELDVPIYPEARFQKEVARSWISSRELPRFATVVELGPSHPLSGRRTRKNISFDVERARRVGF